MAIRLIVFDLDGTLLGADNRLSDYTARVLEKAKAEVDGLVLMAATGRSRWAADLVLDGTRAVDYVICSNGAVLYNRSSPDVPKVVSRRTITRDRLTKLHARVGEVIDGACWAWETEQGVVPDAGFLALGTGLNGELTLDELLASPLRDRRPDPALPVDQGLGPFGRIVRGLLAHPELPCREVSRRLKGQNVPALLSSSSAIFLEVTAPGIHKAVMLKEFCARRGIERHEVVGFGDHLNDLTILRWVGRGIAMANADEQVRRQVAEHTEAPHDKDGVARALEGILAEP